MIHYSPEAQKPPTPIVVERGARLPGETEQETALNAMHQVGGQVLKLLFRNGKFVSNDNGTVHKSSETEHHGDFDTKRFVVAIDSHNDKSGLPGTSSETTIGIEAREVPRGQSAQAEDITGIYASINGRAQPFEVFQPFKLAESADTVQKISFIERIDKSAADFVGLVRYADGVYLDPALFTTRPGPDGSAIEMTKGVTKTIKGQFGSIVAQMLSHEQVDYVNTRPVTPR